MKKLLWQKVNKKKWQLGLAERGYISSKDVLSEVNKIDVDEFPYKYIKWRHYDNDDNYISHDEDSLDEIIGYVENLPHIKEIIEKENGQT